MANLPYNVAAPLVLRTLVEVPAVAHLLVMVQREVGERMAAGDGEDAYGAVSVRIAYFARAEVVGRVPGVGVHPEAAGRVGARAPRAPADARRRPRPRVLRTAGRRSCGPGSRHRRKMLRRSLAGVVEPAAFERAGVRPDARAEELGVAEWGRLAAT